ncbi:hypothetical protein A6U96_14015 [Agrobacterium tumefaciens]|nr:hypothetical protein A6U96_14015 [Agrobacterium tumefaciens]
MAIATYSDLKSALIDWVIVTDAPYDVFISMAEAELKSTVKHYRALKDVTIDIIDNKVTLPDDISEIRFVEIDNKRTKELSLFGGEISSEQAAYERIGNNVRCYGQGKLRKFRIVYWSEIVPLSDVNNTNWLLTNFPNVYFYAALVKFYQREQNAEQTAVMTENLKVAIALLEEDNRKWSLSGTSYSFEKEDNW